MTYEESLAWVSALQGRGWRLGLDRMLAFVKAAGLGDVLGGQSSPIQYLHVAGTNGKGSVTAYLQSMLVAQGYRTGGYFSPFVVDPRERIQINGELISREEFAIVATELREVAERFDQTEIGGITEFEFKTAMAFLAWKRAGVEVVALEVGLGGRLDATNVVIPAACAIVSISLDHTSILGHTEGEIAREKAGIIKPGIPCAVGPIGPEALAVIKEVADAAKAPLLTFDNGVGPHFWGEDNEAGRASDDLITGLPGWHQQENAHVALATIEAGGFLRDEPVAIEAIRNTALVGRMQEILIGGRTVLVDGAHNPASGARLADYLRGTDWVAIVGMLEGHDPAEFFSDRSLSRASGDVKSGLRHVLAVPVDNPRSLPPEAVAEAARSQGIPADSYPSLEEALTRAWPGKTIVTGSFYLVGEAIRLSLGADALT